MHPWWDLPGPGGFVEDLAAALRDGSSVSVALPAHAPPGLPEAVRVALGTRWGWRHLERPSSVSPTDYLYARCLPRSATERRTPRTLVEEADLEGMVLWVDHVAPAELPGWRGFLVSYAEAARGQRHDYARLAVCAHGVEVVGSAWPADLPLVEHRWDGRTGALDVLAYAARIHHGREPTPLEQRLGVELVARLAAFDPHVAARLADRSLSELHRPAEALRAVARERGWPEGAAARAALTEAAWHRGMAGTHAGRRRPHPALLAAAGATEALERLVWQAQVAVVFPFLEERRRDLLDVLDPVLTVPFEHGHGVVQEKGDLELGHLYAQVVRLGGRGTSGLVGLVGAFREARNELAHLRPLRPEVFRTPPFHAYHAPLAAARDRLRAR